MMSFRRWHVEDSVRRAALANAIALSVSCWNCPHQPERERHDLRLAETPILGRFKRIDFEKDPVRVEVVG
jgi:hypothetical protein